MRAVSLSLPTSSSVVSPINLVIARAISLVRLSASRMILVTSLTQQRCQKDHPACGKSHEAYRSSEKRLLGEITADEVGRLRETARTNNVARLIALATTRLKGSERLRLRRQCHKAWRECACDCTYERCSNVARFIALATTRSREIVLATTMS